MTDLWAAPTADGPIDATVEVPGSKSETNRALVIATLAEQPTTIVRPLRARDTDLMVRAIRDLGVGVHDDGRSLRVSPAVLRGPASIDVGLAGTVMRFLPPVAGLAQGPVEFDGDPRARERPMQPLLAALRDLGVAVDDAGRGAMPFVVHGKGRVSGGPTQLDAAGSSQFVSALLLSGCRFDQGLDLTVTGALPSVPHVAMTLAMLRAAEVVVSQVDDRRWQVRPGRPAGGQLVVAPDLSNAAPFLAAATVAGGVVRIPGWADAATQPGDQILAVFASMGAASRMDESGCLELSGTGVVNGIDTDLSNLPELVTTIAALATLAESTTTIRGVGHLRGHETDRLAALAAELNGLGGDVTETGDGLVVRPRPLRPGVFHTYADHRMATAGCLIGLAVPGIQVENVGTTAKTLPGFTGRWTRMLGDHAS